MLISVETPVFLKIFISLFLLCHSEGEARRICIFHYPGSFTSQILRYAQDDSVIRCFSVIVLLHVVAPAILHATSVLLGIAFVLLHIASVDIAFVLLDVSFVILSEAKDLKHKHI